VGNHNEEMNVVGVRHLQCLQRLLLHPVQIRLQHGFL
jgi:hypothetical protein